MINVADLENPYEVTNFTNGNAAIGHNLYVRGNRVYQANYSAGLRVLEYGDLANADIAEIAFFDTVPETGVDSFDGAWSVYPYLPSENLIVSDGIHGLFVLTLQP